VKNRREANAKNNDTSGAKTIGSPSNQDGLKPNLAEMKFNRIRSYPQDIIARDRPNFRKIRS
jgi:hypothetical protein